MRPYFVHLAHVVSAKVTLMNGLGSHVTVHTMQLQCNKQGLGISVVRPH